MADILQIKGLSTGFEDRLVSKSIDLSTQCGCLLTLIGPNGCGKTTLLRTIAGLLPCRGGSILLDGRPIDSYGRRQLAKKISYLPQSRQTPDITAESLVAHGRFPHLGFSRKMTGHDREIVEQAIERAGIDSLRRKRLPQLSGGERQQVYLAMTMAQEASLVLLDEPGTYLDISNRFAAMELATGLSRSGAAVIMTLHELPDAMLFSDRLCLMSRSGDILWDGDAGGLYSSGLLGKTFGVDVKRASTEDGRRTYCFFPKSYI